MTSQKFLLLTNQMNNCIQSDTQLRWYVPNLEFGSDSRVALSSITIDFKTKATENSPIRISTNLIERDMYNPDGVLITFPAHVKDVTHHSNLLEYWRIDSIRPRSVLFTFHGVNVNTISFVSVVLAIEIQ